MTKTNAKYLFLLTISLALLLAHALITGAGSAKALGEVVLGNAGSALFVAVIVAFLMQRILTNNSFVHISNLIAERYGKTYAEEIREQLLEKEMLREHVKCTAHIRRSDAPSGLKIEVVYEYVIVNLSKKQQAVNIVYLLESRLDETCELESIEYQDLSARGSQKWSARNQQLSAFYEAGAFGKRYTVNVDLPAGHKLWAATKSTEYHNWETEIMLVCYQPSMDFMAEIYFEKSVVPQVEWAAEILHPRMSSERTPRKVRDEGEWTVFSYQIGFPCLPYQGMRMFAKRKRGEKGGHDA